MPARYSTVSSRLTLYLGKGAKNCRFKRTERSSHIHNCILKQKARDLNIAEAELIYCYECMAWCFKREWRDHCEKHIQSWNDRHCEVIIYRYTVIRPGYCPCCLWNESLPADERLKPWLRSADLREHIEKCHIEKFDWPLKESVCGCTKLVKSESDFRYHLHDVHGLTDKIWKTNKPRTGKRRVRTESAGRRRKDGGPSPKKIRFHYYQPHCQGRQQAVESSAPSVTQLSPAVEIQSGFADTEDASFHRGDTGTSSSNDCRDEISTACSDQTSVRTTPDLGLIDPRLFEPGPLLDKSVPLSTEVCAPSDNRPSSSNSAKDTQYHDITEIRSWGPSSTPDICNRESDHMSPTVWRKPEPKPAVKRKGGTGAQRKRVGTNDEGETPKKIKFLHSQPVPLHRPFAVEPHLPTTINLPPHDTAQAGLVNQQHVEVDHNARVHTRASSDSEINMGDISTVTSPLSCACMTPDLDLIDPRPLEPGFSGEDGITLANTVPNTPAHRPSSSNDGEDTRQGVKTVAQSCEHSSSLCISGKACDREVARVVEPTASPGRAKPHADIAWVDGGSLEDGVHRGDTPAPRRARTPFSSSSPANFSQSLVPKTRGRMTPRYSSKSPNTGYISKADSLLAPGERSALCRLKSQNLTWRQIMPHFPEKSVAALRQAWMDMEHSSVQRHTRSLRKTRR
jgi:hypothetical protein